jgi:hypothetical protein
MRISIPDLGAPCDSAQVHRAPAPQSKSRSGRLIVTWPAEVVRGSGLVGYKHQPSCPTGVAPRHPVLERYSNIRMLAEQTALEEIDRRRAAQDATRKKSDTQTQAQRHAATAASVAPPLPIL